MNEHIETVVIGAGQAGLSTGLPPAASRPRLRGPRRPPAASATTGATSGTPCGCSPRPSTTGCRACRSPGTRGPSRSRTRWPTTWRRYARTWDLPVRTGVRVRRLGRADGHYVLDTDGGTLTADNVVVATGPFGRTPHVPPFAADLDPSILQLHSSEYRRPDQLATRPGARGGRLALRRRHRLRARGHAPRRALRARPGPAPAAHREPGRALRGAGAGVPGPAPAHPTHPDRPADDGRGPLPRRAAHPGAARGPRRPRCRPPGGADVRCPGRPAGARGRHGPRRRPTSSGAPASGSASTGSTCRSSARTAGREELRGVVDGCPGLFFCGLSFQSGFGSMVFFGVGRDAEYVARRIVERSGSPRGRSRARRADGAPARILREGGRHGRDG